MYKLSPFKLGGRRASRVGASSSPDPSTSTSSLATRASVLSADVKSNASTSADGRAAVENVKCWPRYTYIGHEKRGELCGEGSSLFLGPLGLDSSPACGVGARALLLLHIILVCIDTVPGAALPSRDTAQRTQLPPLQPCTSTAYHIRR